MVRQEEILFIADHRAGWGVIGSGWMLLAAVLLAVGVVSVRMGSTLDSPLGTAQSTMVDGPKTAIISRAEEPGTVLLSRPRFVSKGFAEHDPDIRYRDVIALP